MMREGEEMDGPSRMSKGLSSMCCWKVDGGREKDVPTWRISSVPAPTAFQLCILIQALNVQTVSTPSVPLWLGPARGKSRRDTAMVFVSRVAPPNAAVKIKVTEASVGIETAGYAVIKGDLQTITPPILRMPVHF
jgi:hypothetical protein